MAQATPAFEANDGSLHRDECSAVKRDLDILIAESPLAENGPYAKIATEWLATHAQAIGTVLMHYHDACPIESGGEAPSGKDDGPVVSENAAFEAGKCARQAGKTIHSAHGFSGFAAQDWEDGWTDENDSINAYSGGSIFPNPNPLNDD